MIKRLKLKFISTNMILISVVMLTAFCLLYFNTKNDLEEYSRAAMHDISKNHLDKIDYFIEPEDAPEPKYSYLTTFVIDIDESKKTFTIDGIDKSSEITEFQKKHIINLINAVLSENTVEGVIDKYNMRFFCSETRYGKRIVLLDKRYEDESLRQLAISFVISGSIAFVAFLIISILVANIAVKPVENTVNRQKQFIADVSHELKTPIAVIATNADIILSHEDSNVKDEQKWLGYIKEGATRMSDMVNSMLYLAKTDEGEEKPQLTEFNISNAAYETVLPFESVCFENGKQFDIDIENDVIVKADEISIKRLMIILLDNAIKYSNENGRIKFTLKTNGDKAFLSVFNTGEPIPKESIPHLFERFYRVDKARSRDKGGSGLGLSLAKRIIENNEANISVLSNENNGTVFTCTFKAVKSKKKDK